MFLQNFDEEKKKLFIQLVKKTMEADGVILDAEKQMLDEFCRELNVNSSHYSDESEDVQSIIAKIDRICNRIEKRTILFEIIVISLADKNLDEAENEIIQYMSEKINISKEDKEDMFYFAQNYLEIQQDILMLINKTK